MRKLQGISYNARASWIPDSSKSLTPRPLSVKCSCGFGKFSNRLKFSMAEWRWSSVTSWEYMREQNGGLDIYILMVNSVCSVVIVLKLSSKAHLQHRWQIWNKIIREPLNNDLADIVLKFWILPMRASPWVLRTRQRIGNVCRYQIRNKHPPKHPE